MIPGRKNKDKTKTEKEKEKEKEKLEKEKEKKQLRDEEKRREKEQVEAKKVGSSQTHHVPTSITEPTTHTSKSHQIARSIDTTYVRSFRKGYVEMQYRNSWKYIYVILIGGSFHMYHNSTVPGSPSVLTSRTLKCSRPYC